MGNNNHSLMDVLRDVYTVENLNDSGKGSFREAVETTTGYREIRFAASGTCWYQTRLF